MEFEKYKAFPTFEADIEPQNDTNQSNNSILSLLPLAKVIMEMFGKGKQSPTPNATSPTHPQNNKAYYDFVKKHNEAVARAKNNK